LIRRKSRQMARRAALTEQDCEDLEQEVLLRLLRRLPPPEFGRARFEALVLTILRHTAANLLRARRAAKRGYGRARPLYPGDDVPAARGRGAQDLADLADDLASVLARLPPEDRDLAEHLKCQSIAAVARERGVPRTTLCAAIRRLRARFERAGLRGYL
jgi:RNA polymerase sigma factor (sigma-70 family)